jgi:hypothetical protein
MRNKKTSLSNLILLFVALSAGVTEGLTFFNAIPGDLVPVLAKQLLFGAALVLKIITYSLNAWKKNETK